MRKDMANSRALPFFLKGASMSKKPKKKNGSTITEQTLAKNHFELSKIYPLTLNQQKVFDAYEDGKNLVLSGSAGTGKTFVSLYLALNQILNSPQLYDKIIIIRSTVPSRDMGFLPGSAKEKIAVYEEPYSEICDNLFGRGDGYEVLKTKGIVHFTSTSYLRGLTLNNAIVILDEAQNLEAHEINTVMTRLGDNSRIIICGDFKQTDLVGKYQREGITELIRITHEIESFGHIEFGIDDIVRSGVVKEYLLAREKLGL
jgi:predicted ribonuclease YlaK